MAVKSLVPTRLKYKKVGNTFYCKDIITPQGLVGVFITNLDGNFFGTILFMNKHNSKNLFTYSDTSIVKIKSKIKQDLISLGTVFFDEVRKKGS